jgi:cytidyltransferase-like protein
MKYKNGIFCGCFDLYHVGHQRAIQYCKDRCAILTIGLFTDEAIMGYKGHYPAVPYEYRKELLLEIFPDCQILKLTEHKIHDFSLYDAHFISEEFRGKQLLVDDSYKGETIFFPRCSLISSSEIKRRCCDGNCVCHK